MEGCAEREFTEKVLTHIASGLVALTKDLSSFARRTAEGCCPHKGLFQTFNPSRWRAVAQYDQDPCVRTRDPLRLRSGQALVPLVKTRDFGMPQRGRNREEFKLSDYP